MFLWYTETVFSWYIQSLVLKCAYFISLSNGNTFRSLTIPKRKWYLWGSKPVFVIILTLCLLIKVEKKNFVCIYCTERLNLKNISYWHYFTTKIMSICPIWIFTLNVTQSLHFIENHPVVKRPYSQKNAKYDGKIIFFSFFCSWTNRLKISCSWSMFVNDYSI